MGCYRTNQETCRLLIAFVVSVCYVYSLRPVTSNKGIMGKTASAGCSEWRKVHTRNSKKGWSPDRKLQANAKTENIDQNTLTCCANRPEHGGNENTIGKEYEKLGITCGNEDCMTW